MIVLKLKAIAAGFLLVGLAVVVIQISSITRDDALHRFGLVDGTRVADPTPGKPYRISQAGASPVCNTDDVAPSKELGSFRFVNLVGKSLPISDTVLTAALDVAYELVWSEVMRSSNSSEDRAALLKRIFQKDSTCLMQIKKLLSEGEHICLVESVYRRQGGIVVGVKFDDRCLVPEVSTDPKPIYLPKFTERTIWTHLKDGLSLIDVSSTGPAQAAAEIEENQLSSINALGL